MFISYLIYFDVHTIPQFSVIVVDFDNWHCSSGDIFKPFRFFDDVTDEHGNKMKSLYDSYINGYIRMAVNQPSCACF